MVAIRPTERTRSRTLLLVAIAILSGVGFVALAWAVAGGPLAIDLIGAAALRPLHHGFPGAVIDTVNVAGQPLIWDGLVVALAVRLWRSGRRFEAVVLALGVIAADAGATLLKVIVARPRPPGIEVADLITQAGYPSGHMTRAVVAAGLLAAMTWGSRRWRWAGVLVAAALGVVMGVARVAVGEHWVTDIMGAALYGLFALGVIGLCSTFFRSGFERRYGQPGRRVQRS